MPASLLLSRFASLLAGLGASAALALIGPGAARAECIIQTLAELPVTMVGTRPTIHASINGHDSVFLVDTGLFFSSLTAAAADRFQLRTVPEPRLVVQGIGGKVDGRSTNVEAFRLQNWPLKRVDFVVLDGTGPGVVGAIGQNILTAFDVEYDLANGLIRLIKPQGCPGNATLAYWAKDGINVLNMIAPENSLDRQIAGYATLNGQRIRVLLDSGASLSGLTLHAAARAGVTPTSPGVVKGAGSQGFGARVAPTWIASFDSLVLDGEKIEHTRLRMSDTQFGGNDMLLGADFFLSHRIYVSQGQRKIYFTYNGGPVFRLGEARTQQAAAQPAAADAGPPDPASNTPVDAAGYARRGAAYLGRRDREHAVADFTRAIALEPGNADHYFERAQARMSFGQGVLAMADFDDGLKLRPDDVEALVQRGALFLAARDRARGKADLEHAAQLKGDDPTWGLRIANVYENNELFDEAIAQYDRWVAGNGKDEQIPNALNGRSWARAMVRRDLDLALKDCNTAVRARPGAANMLDTRGLVHLERGELDQAIADYDAALRIQPKTAWSLYGRGLAELKKGLTPQGEADVAAATQLAPRQIAQARRLGFTP